MNRRHFSGAIQCEPLVDNDELFAFEPSSVPWRNLVKPLKQRAPFRALDNFFGLLSFAKPTSVQEQVQKDEERMKVLVCHDLMGNYGSDAAVDKISDKYDSYR